VRESEREGRNEKMRDINKKIETEEEK